MNALLNYVRGVESLSRGLGIAAMHLLLVVLAVLIFPILARGTDVPTIWTLETAQFAVGAYYILGAGYSLQQDAHVRMDFLYANWKPRTKAIVDSVTSLFVLFYLAIMLIGGWNSCAYAVASKQVNHTVWAPYMAPIKIAMEIGILFMFLQMTAELVKSLLAACGKPVEKTDYEAEEEKLYAGRATRRQFFLRVLGCAGAALVGAGLLSVGFAHPDPDGGFSLLALMAGGFLCVAAPIATIPVMVRRLHDLDMSGWWATGLWLFGLVPGFGVLVLIGSAFLLSRDGAPGLTGFGPDPKGRNLITVFDPRLPAKPAPLPEVPVPAEPEAERPYWTPYLVFAGIGLACVVLGYACAAAASNPTWFLLGLAPFLLSLVLLLRGVVCSKNR